MDEKWISVTEAAEESGYSAPHLRELIRAGKIDARKFVTVWQVNRESLLSYLEAINSIGAKRGPKRNN